MSEQEVTGPVGNVDVSESPGANLSKLAELARQAYELKRTKNCLDLTRAILLIDPENAEAQLMRSSIRMEMQLDLENARTLLRNAHLKDNPERYSQAGNTILRKVLRLDPDSEEAQALLSEANPSSPVAAAPPLIEQPPMMPASKGFFDVPFRTGKRQWLKRVGVIIFVGLVVAGLPRFRSKSNLAEVSLSLGASGGSVQALDAHSDSLLKVAADHRDTTGTDLSRLASAASDGSLNAELPSAASVSAAARTASKPLDKPIVLAASGTLAVSSPTSAEIFMDDVYIGSAPVSLEMLAGTYTLEYRHEGLRKTLTHVINSDETTRVMITFDVTVPINAKPWADVFLDGIERQPLGQTPLSNVRVPIGAVLIFENPKFQGKKYRVTGNETGIQIVFP